MSSEQWADESECEHAGQEHWHCPLCDRASFSHREFVDHLSDHPLDEWVNAMVLWNRIASGFYDVVEKGAPNLLPALDTRMKQEVVTMQTYNSGGQN